MADPRSVPPEDLQLGELLVSQGLAGRERVDECLSFLARLVEEGVTPLPRLGDLLVRKGYLTPDQAQATLRPPSGKSPFPAAEAPREVAEAAGDPGRAVGKYVKVARLGGLGAGGMGEVWRAWDRDLRRWVALKFLHHEDPDQLARFRREAQTAAALSHPNIASVYEVGEADGKPFIAMQYVAGQTLATFPRNDLRLLAGLVRDAALALHHAHERGVIHRDLKPANLMVEGSRVYVMDFGLARPTAVGSSLSVSGAVIGTPAYMAPEQARGESRRVTPASDVYGLGAALYELLADRPPFQESEVYALLRRIEEDDPEPVRRRNPAVARDLETIVMKCLEKDPARRYASARELADDLTRWLAGDSYETSFTGFTPEERAANKAAARPLLVGAVAALQRGLREGTERLSIERWGLARTPEDGVAETLSRALRERYLEGRLEKALEILREADAQAPAPEYCRWLASWETDPAAQSRWRDLAIRLAPHASAGYLDRGHIRSESGDLDGALADFDTALRLNPGLGGLTSTARSSGSGRGISRRRRRTAAAPSPSIRATPTPGATAPGSASSAGTSRGPRATLPKPCASSPGTPSPTSTAPPPGSPGAISRGPWPTPRGRSRSPLRFRWPGRTGRPRGSRRVTTRARRATSIRPSSSALRRPRSSSPAPASGSPRGMPKGPPKTPGRPSRSIRRARWPLSTVRGRGSSWETTMAVSRTPRRPSSWTGASPSPTSSGPRRACRPTTSSGGSRTRRRRSSSPRDSPWPTSRGPSHAF